MKRPRKHKRQQSADVRPVTTAAGEAAHVQDETTAPEAVPEPQPVPGTRPRDPATGRYIRRAAP